MHSSDRISEQIENVVTTKPLLEEKLSKDRCQKLREQLSLIQQSNQNVNLDMLKLELNEFVSNEVEYGKALFQVLGEKPPVKTKIENSLFGLELSDCLTISNRQISLIIEYCCIHLLKYGKTEKKLFRVPANFSKKQQIKSQFDDGLLDKYQWPPVELPLNEKLETVHAIAAVLKDYLSQLPDPLLTSELHDEWSRVASLPNPARLSAIKSLLCRLPSERYENLSYLVQFWSTLTTFSSQNGLLPYDIGVLFGSCLVSPAQDEPHMVGTIITQKFIENANKLFPGELSNVPEHLLVDDPVYTASAKNSPTDEISLLAIQFGKF